MLKMWLSIFLSFVVIFLSFSVNSAPADPDEDVVWEYIRLTHESASYNNYEIYRKDETPAEYDNSRLTSSASLYLDKVSFLRYETIDLPIRNAIDQALIEFANDYGAQIKSKSIVTSGTLTISFIPASNANNVLEFSIRGININTTAQLKKSWYADALLILDVNNITINGTYNYFNGVVEVTSVDAPVFTDIDVDLGIPFLDIVFDPIINNYLDDLVDETIPNNLSKLFSGQNSPTFSVLGIKEFIPMDKLYYNGVNYGPIITEKLDSTSLINDNFSISIGIVQYNRQLFSITVGNLTYKLWSTGHRRPCNHSDCF